MINLDIVARVVGSEESARQLQSIEAALGSMRTAAAGFIAALSDAGAVTAIKGVQAALDSAGGVARGATAAVIEQANAIQTLNGVADETVRAQQKVVGSLAATAEQGKRLPPVLQTVATAMGTTTAVASRQLGQALDGQNSQFLALGSTLVSMRTAAAGFTGALAGSGAIAALRGMWTAAEEARVAQHGLQAALDAAGGMARGAAEAMMEQANALQNLTGVADETVMSVQRIFLSMGATADQVQRLTPLVLDVAAAMGTDATTAARQLGQALDGQDIQLGRLNIKVRSVDELVEVLNQRFRGQAQALAAARGPMVQLQVAVGELQEKLGALLAWSATPFIQELTRIGQALERIAGVQIGARTSSVLGLLLQNTGSTLNARGVASAAELLAGMVGGLSTPSLDQQAAAAQAAEQARITDALAANGVNAAVLGMRAPGTGAPGGNVWDEEEHAIEMERYRQAVEDAAAEAEWLRQIELETGEAIGRQIEVEKERQAAMQEAVDAAARELEIKREIARQSSYVATTNDRWDRFQEGAALDDQAGVGGGVAAGWKQAMMDLGTVAQAAGETIRNTVGAAINSVSSGLTGLIMGTQTWAGALRQIAGSIINELINGFVRMFAAWIARRLAASAAEKTAATAEAAAKAPGALMDSITSFGIAAAVGAAAFVAAMALAGGWQKGGYTGDGPAGMPAGVVHRGEFVVPADAVDRIGIHNLEAMTWGPDAGTGGASGTPTRIVIVDNRRDADELGRDPRFRSLIIDLMQQA